MAVKLQIRRGAEASLPALDIGELGWCTDSYKLFVGMGGINKEVCMKATFDTHTGNADAHHTTFTPTQHDARDHTVVASTVLLSELGSKAHSELTGVGANDHHNQSHVIISTTDHSASGLIADQALVATGATTFAWGWVGLSEGERERIEASPNMTLGGTWAWYDLTGCSTTFTTSNTEDWVIIGAVQFNKNGAGGVTAVYVGLTKDGGVSTQEIFRFSPENDDWPRRTMFYDYVNVPSGTYTLQVRGKVSDALMKYINVRFHIIRFKH